MWPELWLKTTCVNFRLAVGTSHQKRQLNYSWWSLGQISYIRYSSFRIVITVTVTAHHCHCHWSTPLINPLPQSTAYLFSLTHHHLHYANIVQPSTCILTSTFNLLANINLHGWKVAMVVLGWMHSSFSQRFFPPWLLMHLLLSLVDTDRFFLFYLACLFFLASW